MMRKTDSQISNRAVIYARVSSERQAEEGYSIGAQLDLLRDFAKSNGFAVAKEFVDQETAKSAGRTHFSEMLRFLASNPTVKNVLVEKTDRLYRNMRDYVDLGDLGLNIYLVKENDVLSDKSTSSTKFMHRIKLVMAQHYCDNLSEEVIKGMNKKASLGEWPSKAPIGYFRNVRDHLIYPDPERSRLIHRLFKEYSTGKHSLKSLKTFAYEIGLRSVNGKPVNKAGIHRILKNLIYTGQFIYKGKVQNNGVHESIVSHELFRSVQQVLNGGFTPKQTKRNFAFRGVLKCHRCG